VQAGFDEKAHQSKVIADILTMTEQHVRREARDDVNLDDTIDEVSKHHPDGNLYAGLKGWMAVFKAGGLERYEKKQQEKEGSTASTRPVGNRLPQTRPGMI
jgi:hypothetical protein